MKVLIVEDNSLLAERMKRGLQRWFIVETVSSGDAALHCFYTSTYDAVILDLGLPDINGRTLCKQIRHQSSAVPILIVTGEATSRSVVELLNNGADDYLTKPFDITELRARLNSLFRRQARSPHHTTITIGDLIINPLERTVTRAGEKITLRRKEFDILEYLVLNPGRIMKRQNILDYAWANNSSPWTGLVDVHIKQLRDKIDRPFKTHLIRTVYGVGYVIDDPGVNSEANNAGAQETPRNNKEATT